jgi:hypothetical protein
MLNNEIEWAKINKIIGKEFLRVVKERAKMDTLTNVLAFN